ncbi:MAG: Hsp33 family molecular chaperone HslO [Bdellovibrionota bacterium]
MFQDYLFFGVDSKVFYSYRMLHLSATVEEARKMHGLSLNKGLLLSDALLGSVLLSSLLEYEQRINLRIHCGDHFTIGTETNAEAQTRGYIECNENSDIVKSIDQGTKAESELIVRSIRSQKNKTSLFEGVTSSYTNSIQDALNEHLSSSYQMNTKLRLNSWINPESQTLCAFGVIYQELPEIPMQISTKLENYIASLPSMQELYLFNSDPDILAQKLIPDETKAVKSIHPKFVCECSTEKVESAIAAFPVEDLEDMIHKRKDIEVKCHYCSKNHIVTAQRVGEIYTRLLNLNNLN